MSYLQGLNESQHEAVIFEGKPLIVLAGAGSGKTKMLISRICHSVIHRGISPLNILGVTFTNKAAQEMRHRIETFGGTQMYGITLSTFHSFGAMVLRRDIPEPRNPNFVIYDSADQLSLLKDILKKLNIDPKAFSPKTFSHMINALKNDGLDPDEVHKKYPNESFNPFVNHLYKVLPIYEEELRRRNACDFGDMLSIPLKLFEENKEILQRWQARYPVVLVDEYQDTNPVQYKLLKLLKEYYPEEFCVVGDEDQSIYRWRGADISNILNFEKDFPGAKIIKLEQNYRSTKNIIDAASAVIAKNSERYDKVLWTDNHEGENISLRICFDEKEEAAYVVNQIDTLMNQGVSYDETVILYRTNAQSRSFEDELLRKNIAYQIIGGLRFYERMEVKDILGYFKFLLNPRDTVSFQRIINTPARGIGATSVEKILDYATGKNIDCMNACLELRENPGGFSAAKKLEGFIGLMETFRDILAVKSGDQLSVLLTEVLHQTGYLKKLKDDGTDESKARVQNLDELANVIAEFEEKYQGDNTLAEFLQTISLESPADNFQSNNGTVSLMTIHMAKGLEFSYVFVVGLEEGLFPSGQSIDQYADCEEERRLMYVAMTRAKKKLYLTHANCRRIYGQMQEALPSRFIAEIPQKFIQITSPKGFKKFGSPSSFGEKQYEKPSSGFHTSSNPNPNSRYFPGQLVKHITYGVGSIQKVEGSGEDERVEIYFQSAGPKRFLTKFANLQVV